jgi:hypothetical protein
LVKELLKQLVDLQRKDSLFLKNAGLSIKCRSVSSMLTNLKQAKLELETIKKKHEAVSKKAGKETALSEAQEKIRKMKARVSDMKTNKEFQAYQKEIEA